MRAVADDDLGDRVGESAPEVRRDVPIDERDLRAALGDQQGMREDRGPVGIEIRHGLQRHLDCDIGRHVQEGSAGPEGAVQRGELRAVGRHQRVQVLVDQVRVLLGGDIQVAEDDALRLEILTGGGHDHARVVLEDRRREARLGGRRCSPAVTGCVRDEVQREVRHVGVAPLLRLVRRQRQHLELREGALADRAGGTGCDRQRIERSTIERRHPTEPSICSSTRRFSSTAYSIGSSRVIGSMKPFTIIAVASTSDRPRLIR